MTDTIARPTPKKRNATKGARTRAMLKQVARNLFEIDGHAGVTAQAIVEAAGISSGTFYTYFTNKDDIIFEICSEFFDEMIRSFEDDRLYETEYEYICIGHYIYIKTIFNNWNLFKSILSYSFVNEDISNIMHNARVQEAQRTAAYLLTRWNQSDKLAPEIGIDGAIKLAMALHAMTEGYLQDELRSLPFDTGLDDADLRKLALYMGRLFYRAAFLEEPPVIQFDPKL